MCLNNKIVSEPRTLIGSFPARSARRKCSITHSMCLRCSLETRTEHDTKVHEFTKAVALTGRLCKTTPPPPQKRLTKKQCLHKKEDRDRERKSEGRLLKAVQHCKHGLKAPASQQVNHHTV
ncbi:hypothetical protein Q7C36_022702 [Tachysurus vachellii]|uniref:Uncharacterized protein n=1 Tax=Tachysurus vachellii TaxID=175792 RepID=A0AA88IN99_TACVA|nr:hypothetical protein Q7C36_022702 [Tachysurus vachellii]